MIPEREQLMWNPARQTVITAVLRLTRPRPPPFGSTIMRNIRAFTSNVDTAATLFRSVQHNATRIVLNLTPTISEHGILHIDLAISAQINDVEQADDYRRIWDAIVARTAEQITTNIAFAIEGFLRTPHESEQ